MTFLNPDWQDAKIYRWDDGDAPQIGNTANSVITILKACLVTGYGSKQGAGWTMPFEDMTNGIKVFKPADSENKEFYLKVSNDDGSFMTPKIYFNMTAIDNGDLKLQTTHPMKYFYVGVNTDKWVCIATNRSVYLFTNFNAYRKINQGSYLFAGDTARNSKGNRAIWLGASGDDKSSYKVYGLTYTGGDTQKSSRGQGYDVFNDVVTQAYGAISTFNARSVYSHELLVSPLLIKINNDIYPLPGLYTSSRGTLDANFVTHSVSVNAVANELIVLGSAAWTGNESMIQVATKKWGY